MPLDVHPVESDNDLRGSDRACERERCLFNFWFGAGSCPCPGSGLEGTHTVPDPNPSLGFDRRTPTWAYHMHLEQAKDQGVNPILMILQILSSCFSFWVPSCCSMYRSLWLESAFGSQGSRSLTASYQMPPPLKLCWLRQPPLSHHPRSCR